MPEFGKKITLRPMRSADLEDVLAIESASFSRPWTRTHFEEELASAFSHPTVALAPGGALAGYLCLKQVLDEAEILDVAVKGTFRGMGVGKALVQWAFSFCRERGVKLLFLEVRAGNAEAIGLYRRLGFRESGRRKKYYDNGEDAILMDISIREQAGECDAV